MDRPSDRRLSGQTVCGGRIPDSGRNRESIGHLTSVRTACGQKEGEKGVPLGRTVAFPLGLGLGFRVRVEF